MIKVYVADLTGLEEQYDKKVNMLHQSRADKLALYQMSADRVRGLGAGLLLEKGLEDYLKVQSKDSVSDKSHEQTKPVNAPVLPKDDEGRIIIEYSYGPNGKPYLKDYPNIHFSLSHSGKMAVLAMADTEVGIDVQEFRGYKERIAKRFFHEKENKMLEAVSESLERETLFYKIWTCKEGYIKYTGQGMGQDLRNFYYDARCERICSGDITLANCQEIPLSQYGYFCSLVSRTNSRKADKIIKLTLA